VVEVFALQAEARAALGALVVGGESLSFIDLVLLGGPAHVVYAAG